MADFLLSLLSIESLLASLVLVGAFVTVYSFLNILWPSDQLAERMKAVTDERMVIREREREKLHKSGGKEDAVSLRQQDASGYMKDVLQKVDLTSLFDFEEVRTSLFMAGYRAPSAFVTFLFIRLIVPAVIFFGSFILLFLIEDFGLSFSSKMLVMAGTALLGFFLPSIILSRKIQARQKSIRLAFADALDLLLICVESGMSIDAGLTRVSQEIGMRSVELAEELVLMTAELAYLQDRARAYDNLARRTGLEEIKIFVTTVMQADKYGMPLAQALQTLASENRSVQMHNAEKKAAGLGPKLTVPMIVFFLPVLFIVILGPAIIQVIRTLG